MQKYWNTVQDEQGRPRYGASVAVQQNGVNSTIYSTSSGTVKTNPIVTDATRGYFEFFAASGAYDLVVSGVGFDSYTITSGAEVGLPSGDVSFAPSGTGALTTRTVQDALRAMVRTGDYDTVGHFNTARDALTETIGIKSLQIGTSAAASGIYFPARTAGRGGSAFYTFDATFNGTVDPSVNFGYNLTAAGAVDQAGEPTAGFAIEGNYNDGSGNNKMEMYFQFTGLTGQGAEVRRPYFVQVNRDTSALTNQFYATSHTFGSADAASPSLWLLINSTGIGSGLNSALKFCTGATSVKQFEVAHVAGAVNYLQTFAGTTGQPAFLGPQGESNITFGIYALGTGDIKFTTAGTTEQAMRILRVSGATRSVDISGSTTNPTITTSAGSLAITPAIVAASSITTGTPSGGTSGAWKFGIAAVVSPTSPNRTIELDIGGTIYYLHAKTTNN